MTERAKLRAKLCRELAQSEHSAECHSTREAKRLGAIPPAHALAAIAEHARTMAKRFAAAAQHKPTFGLAVGRAVGEACSLARHLVFERMSDVERSYRGTLLGAKQGTDVARLLREVALLDHEKPLIDFVNAWLPEREALLRRAETELAWFAQDAALATKSVLAKAFS